MNNLAGSRHRANFADGVFTIGRSAREPDVRFVKQLKVRSAELDRHGEIVAVCRVEKRGPPRAVVRGGAPPEADAYGARDP